MKIYFLLLSFSIIGISVYGGGPPQRDTIINPHIQLRIINLSDTIIDFYFNNLNNVNARLDIKQEVVTYKSPITDEYPGFIAIKKDNYNFEIYRTGSLRSGQIGNFIVLVYNDKVEFYRVSDIDKNYLELNLMEYNSGNFDWWKIEISENNMIIEIENLTGEKVTISSDGYLFRNINHREIIGEWSEDMHFTHLENETKYIYTVNSEIFSLKNIWIEIFYESYLRYPNLDQIGYGRPRDRIIINNLKRRNIKIILYGYDIGYEIRFI